MRCSQYFPSGFAFYGNDFQRNAIKISFLIFAGGISMIPQDIIKKKQSAD